MQYIIYFFPTICNSPLGLASLLLPLSPNHAVVCPSRMWRVLQSIQRPIYGYPPQAGQAMQPAPGGVPYYPLPVAQPVMMAYPQGPQPGAAYPPPNQGPQPGYQPYAPGAGVQQQPQQGYPVIAPSGAQAYAPPPPKEV